jgi:hypothetical protein
MLLAGPLSVERNPKDCGDSKLLVFWGAGTLCQCRLSPRHALPGSIPVYVHEFAMPQQSYQQYSCGVVLHASYSLLPEINAG